MEFVPGYALPATTFLGRFLPPLAEGIAARYVERYSKPGDLIFDPFGQSPQVPFEALRLERRVLVAGHNPISRLALSLALRPPSLTKTFGLYRMEILAALINGATLILIAVFIL